MVFGVDNIASSDLKIEDLPMQGENWQTFALTFPGIESVKTIEDLGPLWDKMAPNPEFASIDELRGCLYFLQRCVRWGGEETVYDTEQANNIIEYIKDKLNESR